MAESNYPDWCRDSSELRRLSRLPDRVQTKVIREDVEWEIERLRGRLERLVELLERLDED